MLHVVRRFIRSGGALLAICAALLASPAALAVDSGDIIVVGSKGEVHITVNGAERKMRAGGVLELPATVRTGRNGSVELKQGATTVSVGPETLLEFPALEKPGAPIDRIVQPRGNAFYNIGKREGRKLRVETPYLVGVIKGTQFNVAAQEGSTTISLFEGLLEVHATDESDVVDLKAGQIATLKRGDKSIGILKMDAGKTPTGSRPATAPGSNSSGGTQGPETPRVSPSGDDVSLTADRDPISVRTDVRADTSVAGLVEPAAQVAVNVSPTGADIATNLSVDTGAAAVDVGVGTAVNAAAGTVDVSTAATVDAGPVSTDLGTSTSVDLGAGTVDTSLTVAATAPVVDVAVSTDVAVDAAAGTVDVGLDVAVDAPVLGDTVDTVTETVTDTVTDTVDTAGGLLNGLIRQPGKK